MLRTESPEVDDYQDAFSSFDEDVINNQTSLGGVIRALAKRDCRDLTSLIDLTASSGSPRAFGGFCDVYESKLLDTNGTRVAIKCLQVYANTDSSGDSPSSQILKQSAKELYHWSKLQHPNVLRLMGLALFHERISMVSQWMVNGSLVMYLSKNPLANRINLCKDVCAGLSYIHDRQMVHGDLKAANVVVSPEGVAMIADFGNARLRELSLKFSASTRRVLSLRWATALEIVSDKVPYPESEEHAIMYLVTHGTHSPRPRSGIEDELWELLKSCWALSPMARPAIKSVEGRLDALYPDSRTNSHQDDENQRPNNLAKLGDFHVRQFESSGDIKELDEAISCYDQSVKLAPDQHAYKPGRLANLGDAYKLRFGYLGDLTDIRVAIDHHKQAVRLTPDDHHDKPAYLNSLGNSYLCQFEALDSAADVEAAISCHAQVVLLTPDDHEHKAAYIGELGVAYRFRFEAFKQDSDIEAAIDLHKRALDETPIDRSERSQRFSDLGTSYMCRFDHSKNREDINKAIEFHSQAILLDSEHANKLIWLHKLGQSCLCRFENFGERPDLESAFTSFRKVAQFNHGDPRVRFDCARQWARASLQLRIPPKEAYQKVMELMPQLVWLGTSVKHRFRLLIQIGDVAMEAASYAISLKPYHRALEWLEEGRAVVWNQMLQLRTPFDDLSAVNAKLAKRLQEIGCELERAISHPVTTYFSRGSISQREQTTQHLHRLAIEWDQLLAQARGIPGFETLLRPRKAKELMSAAKDGPVVVINVHSSRCDALVIKPGSEAIGHVHLDRLSPEIAANAHVEITSSLGLRGFPVRKVGMRKIGRPRQSPDMLMKRVLEVLWLDVVKPVLDHLGITQTDPHETLPHITWCTTGPLALLPLHAAGVYDQSQISVYDTVVSSYTPTLRAMLSSYPPSFARSDGLVAVGQENAPGMTKLPGTVEELQAIKRCLDAEGVRCLLLEDTQATIHNVLTAMQDHSWVHLACHGTQHPGDPTKSALHLHDGRLTLFGISRGALTNKGLAFLSACQTATGDKNLPDEAAHLAAGMLMAGYPSVVATFWSVMDEDAPDVASRLYAEVVKNGELRCSGVARALHKSVSALRAKLGDESIARWAAWVHIGS